jgi:hypothetical protein
VLKRWPDTSPSGYGRGVLLGDQVIWPTRTKLYVFDQAVTAERIAARDPIVLSEERDATGGNLVAADGILLIATPDKLFAFHQQGTKTDASTAKVALGERVPAQPAAAPPQAPSGTIKDTPPTPR